VHAIGVRVREQPATGGQRRRWPWAVVIVLGCTALLFFCYLRVAGTVRVNSDAAGLVLQASDMLHGNLLLHGWWDTDVSFITTELPEYMGVTAITGVRPDVVHICSALTYTLLVLLAALVARGRAHGAEGVVRALLAAGVMLAPQPTGPTQVLLGSPDHVGTALPLLLLLLLLDRMPDPRARAGWYVMTCCAVCVTAAALLALMIVGDPLTEVVGVVPLVIACLLRAVRISVIRLNRTRGAAAGGDGLPAVAAGPAGVAAGPPADAGPVAAGPVAAGPVAAGPVAAGPVVAGPVVAGPVADGPGAADPAAGDRGAADTSWRAACCQLLLAAAALSAVPLAQAMNSLIRRHHGYQLGPNLYGLQPLHEMVKSAPMIWRSFLVLFGADYADVSGAGNVAFALAHLAGVAVVIAAVAFAVWRLLVPVRAARAGDLVANFLVLAVLVNIAAYFVFVQPQGIYTAHEIGPVASFGAALTGRMLGGPALRAWLAARKKPDKEPGRPAGMPGGKPRPRLSALRRYGARVLLPALAVGFACYLALLGIAATYPQAPAQNDTLTSWLSEHHLSSGLASYWEASSVTVDSGGQITMLAVGIHGWNRRLAPDKWETDVQLASPKTHSANFVVAGPDLIVPAKLAIEMFGKPPRTYRYGPYTIMVWDKNLLGELNSF
jgi:hypothetical protein